MSPPHSSPPSLPLPPSHPSSLRLSSNQPHANQQTAGWSSAQQLNRTETIKGTLHSSSYVLDSPGGDSALACVTVWVPGFRLKLKRFLRRGLHDPAVCWSRPEAQLSVRAETERAEAFIVCLCACTYPAVGLPVTSHSALDLVGGMMMKKAFSHCPCAGVQHTTRSCLTSSSSASR